LKAFAIPTATSGLTAALSVLFFVGMSRVMGDELLGHVIFVQASAAIITTLLVPQCWVYLIAAQRRDELISRYRTGFTVELLGFAAGALLITAVLALFPANSRWDGCLFIYASIAVQASSSCQGWLRATESWGRYVFWTIGPNLIRVPLIWSTPWMVSIGWLPDARGDQALVILLYFLVPDVLRWALIALPIALQNYRWQGITTVVRSTRIILKNWLFDVGSAVTETADKLVVGVLLGPQVLVIYFFARRLGIVATMVCEPFYLEHYRRIVSIGNSAKMSAQQIYTYIRGIAFATTLFLGLIASIALTMMIPGIEDIIPGAVLNNFAIFSLILLLDCLLAANRWSRFVAQINGGSTRLLAIRIGIFSVFVLSSWLACSFFGSLGLVFALAVSWMLEATYVGGVLIINKRRSTRK